MLPPCLSKTLSTLKWACLNDFDLILIFQGCLFVNSYDQAGTVDFHKDTVTTKASERQITGSFIVHTFHSPKDCPSNMVVNIASASKVMGLATD